MFPEVALFVKSQIHSSYFHIVNIRFAFYNLELIFNFLHRLTAMYMQAWSNKNNKLRQHLLNILLIASSILHPKITAYMKSLLYKWVLTISFEERWLLLNLVVSPFLQYYNRCILIILCYCYVWYLTSYQL